MNNEVKELLSRLKRCNEEQYLVEIDCRCSKLLLDCITDLKEENEDYRSRCEKAIPMLKELNIKLKDILKIGIDIKEISDIENILKGGDE